MNINNLKLFRSIKYTIKKPIWNNQSVGIADYRLKDDILLNISYKNQEGDLVYPGSFFIKKETAKTYPVQVLGTGTKLHIIPIKIYKLHIKPIAGLPFL